MDNHFGAFLAYQCLGVLGSRPWNHDHHGNRQMAPRKSNCDTRVSARRRNESFGAPARIFLAGQADSANFE